MHVIWVTGLALPSILCSIVFLEHRAAGDLTVDFMRGLELIAPLTLLVFAPFAALSAITRRTALKITTAQRNEWITWNFVASGAFVGLIITLSNFVIEPMRYSGPGGFAEALGMMMALWIFTLPLLLFWSVLGVFVGGLIGLIFAVIRTLLVPNQTP